MLALKLALVALAALASSLVARRFGHAAGGLLAGLPLIAGTISGFLLLQVPAADVRAIALATLVGLPATIAHLVAFAWTATRAPWPLALAAANAVFFALGALLLRLPLPAPAAIALAAVVLAGGGALLPRRPGAAGAVAIPALELVCRVVVALAIGALILGTAGAVPAAWSGLLLAVPITGNVLPCFTLPRYGIGATVALLRGFIRGLSGFGAFFAVLVVSLGHLPPAAAWVAGWAAAIVVAALARRR